MQIRYNRSMKNSYFIMSQFSRLIETIANSKMRKLDFGNGMILFRGEIHMIRAIGDHPGMYISEIARYFGVTRAVISKSALKLEEGGYIRKAVDPEDKKRVQLYLTQQGESAYQAHNEFHYKQDDYIFSYLEGLNEQEREAVTVFLEKAQQIVDHHF
ncbi:MarR family winged helix-turn-helix transcriptional regulator [Anaerospora hongkongensis]|nr:MarR family transcriptional regulator [Anaerospora hongkongensis]